MAGSSAPVMYWTIHTTLCRALRSDAKQLPYQVVMQPVKMLSAEEDALSRPLHNKTVPRVEEREKEPIMSRFQEKERSVTSPHNVDWDSKEYHC